jgi:integrase/recombinase XerD
MKVQGHGQAKILTAAEINKLFNEGFATSRDRALFGFCLYTGCRVSEACSLVTEDIYCGGQQIEARSVVTIRKGNTKGDEATRQIDTHPKLKALLEDYVPGDRYVFPGRHRHSGSINPISADAILKAACERMGLEGVSTHSFRRTALTRMSNAGVPLRHIQEISGHKDLATLQKYLEVSPEHRKSAIAALDF